ncbi:MAG: LytS/YehU family sensor histidine kinase [Flavobacteriales bacterium]|jgi:LytS/YehU family sensor histidine kinase
MDISIFIAAIASIIALASSIWGFSLNKRKEALTKELNENKAQGQRYLNELNETKLASLKFTLNPHSFRNTLNSIQHVAQRTLSSVENLSVILDYMLYETKDKYVPIEKEIDFAKKYFNLYKLKVSPLVTARFQIDERFNDTVHQSLQIAPLITAHFIENAFKHADLEIDDAFIELKLELVYPSSAIYSVRNTIKSSRDINSKGGIGAGNFKDRLQILYPEKHYLDTIIEDGIYSSYLKITL